mgnify:FL=1
MSTHRTRRAAVVLMVAALITAGCAKEIDGTPVATPGQAGKWLGPADLLSTTCRQFLQMDEPGRREVITAIGESGNKFIAGNPELWAGVAGALCGFVDPSAPVKDIILGMR